MISQLSVVIRRFRVRIPGRIERSCWPNGKAPDYGTMLILYLLHPHVHLIFVYDFDTYLWLFYYGLLCGNWCDPFRVTVWPGMGLLMYYLRITYFRVRTYLD